jgi:hypothetical protein
MLCKRAYRLVVQPRSASSELPAPCRFVYTHARISKGNDLGPTRDNAHQTLRIRQDTNERDLPLPPLLDPVVLEKRSRWESVKSQPKAADLTSFQKRLQTNPYGMQYYCVYQEIMLTKHSPCTRITGPPMSRNPDIAPGCISHLTACSSTPYDQRPMAPPCFTHHRSETTRASISLSWQSVHNHTTGKEEAVAERHLLAHGGEIRR